MGRLHSFPIWLSLVAGLGCAGSSPAPEKETAPRLASFQADDGKSGRKKMAAFESGELKPSGPVIFEAGTDTPKAESDVVLNEVRESLVARTDFTLLRIEGHTDTDGMASANQTLSEKRALAVARWLGVQGVDCRRLIPVGFGGTKPVAENSTPEGKAQNRRMAFVVAALRGRPLGGIPVDGGGKVAGDPCLK